jgi:hypothetical protein
MEGAENVSRNVISIFATLTVVISVIKSYKLDLDARLYKIVSIFALKLKI